MMVNRARRDGGSSKRGGGRGGRGRGGRSQTGGRRSTSNSGASRKRKKSTHDNDSNEVDRSASVTGEDMDMGALSFGGTDMANAFSDRSIFGGDRSTSLDVVGANNSRMMMGNVGLNMMMHHTMTNPNNVAMAGGGGGSGMPGTTSAFLVVVVQLVQ